MSDDLLLKPRRRRIQDLNIVPILDMLTTVIFFLLLSTTFLEYVKVTVPPSSVTTITKEEQKKPLATSPELYLVRGSAGFKLVLNWSGSKAGSLSRSISAQQPAEARTEILARSTELAREFAKLNSQEKTVKLGLGSNVPFQHLITVMDGIREVLPDVVLVSYNDAEARAAEGQ